jgi:hypothetical protein
LKQLNSRIESDNPGQTAGAIQNAPEPTEVVRRGECHGLAQQRADFINEQEIEGITGDAHAPGAGARFANCWPRRASCAGFPWTKSLCLSFVDDPELLAEVYSTAKEIKEEIYGSRLVLFAPLYISNRCSNECTYCAFRASNTGLTRRTLTQEEIAEETRILVRQGHKRILMVAGEALPQQGFEYILDSIATVYATNVGPGEIRRVNVNLAPETTEHFRLLKQAGIGTFQLFQETYHRPTYAEVHVRGRKRDYDWRTTAFDRAMEAGIDRSAHGQTRFRLPRTWSSCAAREVTVILFFQALLMLLAYDVLSALCRFQTIYSLVRGWKVTGETDDAGIIDRVCIAVNYACVWYPKQALCLQRSFVTTYLLRKRGVTAQMVLGAQKLPFKAHAWVEVDRQAINERSNVQATYAVWDRC